MSRALRVPRALTVPAQRPQLPTRVHGPGPQVSPWGSQPLPQQGPSPAPHSPALPRHRSRQAGTTCEPMPWPILICSCPQKGSQCLGLGLSRCPQLPCSWLVLWDESWLLGPATTYPGESPTLPVPGHLLLWCLNRWKYRYLWFVYHSLKNGTPLPNMWENCHGMSTKHQL